MAGEDIDLRVNLVDRRNAARELARIDAALARTGQSASRSGRLAASGARGFDRMSAGVRGLAGVAGKGLVGGLAVGGAALAGFSALVGQGVRDMLNVQRIQAQTNAVVKSTGGVAKVSASGVAALSESIERSTGIEAESVMQGQNMLLTFTNLRNEAGKGNKVFDQATRTLTDMTTALGSDPQSQAVQLGKALNDPIKGISALSKVGVSFTEQQKDQIAALVEGGDTMSAQKIILAELNKEFGGSAKAFGQTDIGKIERFKNAIGNVGETLAGTLAPMLGRVSTQLVNKGVPALERWGQTFNRKVVPGVRAGIRETRALWRTFREDGIDGLTRRVETLTGTQGKLTPIVEKVRDVLADLGRIVTGSVLPAFTDSEGAISAVISPLGYVDDAVKFLADHATLTKNAIVGLVTALTLAKVAGIASAAASGIVTAAVVTHAAATSLLTGAVVVNTGTERSAMAVRASSIALHIRGAAVMVAQTVATIATTVATKAMTAGQWLLNAALLANPVGLVIAGIVLLVGALILAYKKSDTFRKIVDGAFKAVKNVVLDVVGWFKTWVPGVFSFVAGAIRKYVTTYWSIVKTAFNIIKRVVTSGMDVFKAVVRRGLEIAQRVWGGIEKFIGVARTTFNSIKNVIKGIIDTIKTIIGSVVEKIQAVIDKIQAAINKARELAGMGTTGSTAIPQGLRDRYEDAAGAASAGTPGGGRTVDERGVPSGRATVPQVGSYRPKAPDGAAAAHRELDVAMRGGDQPTDLREALTVNVYSVLDGKQVAETTWRRERTAAARG